MKPYEKYKDSGVEWIGKVPEHWEVKRLKWIGFFRSGEGITSEMIFPEGDFPVFGGNGIRGFYNKFTHDGTFILIGRQGALCGNIQYGKGKFWASEHAIVVHPLVEYAVIFLGELLRSMNLNQYSVAAAQPGLSVEMIKNLKIPFPPLPEQTAIARYLDQKTGEIDQLIAQKERLLALWEEEKTALINQAVTRGLDAGAKMKDSGVAWLGEVPEGWEVKPLKFVLRKKKGALKTGPFGSQLKTSDFDEFGSIKIYNQRNVLDNDFVAGNDRINDDKFAQLKEFLIEEGDILFTSRGSIGKCAIFPAKMEKGILHPCLIRIQINENLVLPQWILCYANSSSFFLENVKLESNSTIIDVIYGGTLKEIVFPIPPLPEQAAIVRHIETQTARIQQQMDQTRKLIELLKEYRATLISEVVTGKVKITE